MTIKESKIGTPGLKKVWLTLWNRMGANRLPFILSLIFSLGQTFVMMSLPLIENLYFNFLEDGRFGSIQMLLLTSAVAFFFFIAIFAYGEYLKKTTMTKLNLDMTMELADVAQRLPLETAQGSHSSDLVQRVTNDTKQTTGLLKLIMDDMGNQIVMFLMAIIYIMWLNWKIGLVLLIISPLLLLSSHLLRNRLKKIGYEIAEQEAVIRQYMQDTIQNLEIVHAYGIGKWMENRYVQKRMHLNHLYMKRMWLRQAVTITSSTLIDIIVIGTVVIVGWLAIKGIMTIGSLMAFFTLVWRFNGPLSNIAENWGRIQEGLGSAGRVFTLLEEETEPEINKEVQCISDSAISLQRIHFSYQIQMGIQSNSITKENPKKLNEGNFLLDDFSLEVDRGSFIAIVGPSGSGKSTVAKIAAGLLFPVTGDVNICGLNPLDNSECAREKIAYVPQTSYLFSETIRDNLLLGKPNASETQMKSATKMALAHDFILDLPDGYDTKLHEQGSSLSGGQRQRLAIARALLADRPIWIFDEATSALDFDTERTVMQNIVRSAEDQKRTIIVIAHRLTTVQNADHIIVMKNGRVIQKGKHDDLMNDYNNFYWEMSREV